MRETVFAPPHYGGDNNPHEVIKCLAAWGLERDAFVWNAGKYIARAFSKGDPSEQLLKACYYLLRRVGQLENREDPNFYNDLIKQARDVVGGKDVYVTGEPVEITPGEEFRVEIMNPKQPKLDLNKILMTLKVVRSNGTTEGNWQLVDQSIADLEAVGAIEGLSLDQVSSVVECAAIGSQGQTEHQLRVEAMMKGFGQEVFDQPADRDEKTRILRARLIMEEALETIQDGLRVDVATHGFGPIEFEDLEFKPKAGRANLAELADGCADISVVTVGTLSAFGIKDKPLLEEVDNNNLLKLKTATKDEFGKFVKHPDHPPPDINGVLASQALTESC